VSLGHVNIIKLVHYIFAHLLSWFFEATHLPTITFSRCYLLLRLWILLSRSQRLIDTPPVSVVWHTVPTIAEPTFDFPSDSSLSRPPPLLTLTLIFSFIYSVHIFGNRKRKRVARSHVESHQNGARMISLLLYFFHHPMATTRNQAQAKRATVRRKTSRVPSVSSDPKANQKDIPQMKTVQKVWLTFSFILGDLLIFFFRRNTTRRRKIP